MAEKKQRKIISASTGEEVKKSTKKRTTKTTASGKTAKQAAPTGNATAFRIGAIVLWVLAIGFEVVALLMALGKISFDFMPTLYQMIIALVLDLACVIIGSQLWKKANHIKPASEANKTLFWIWNNMGVIVCVIAFVPFIIVLLTNKNTDKKTKVIATVVAVIALLIGGVSSYDFNPVSVEQQEAAINALGDEEVYWSPFGKVYHTNDDCHALNRSDTLTYGTVDEAIAAHRTRLCAYCAKADAITGVVTDGSVEDIEDVVEDVIDDVEEDIVDEDVVEDVDNAEDAA